MHDALGVPDILARILELSLPRPFEEERRRLGPPELPSPIMTELPWLFMLVCKSWHDVTYNSPSLWSTFIASVAGFRYDDIRHLPFMLETHLERSKKAPLTLVMDFGFALPSNNERNPLEIVRILILKALESQERWYNVNIMLYHDAKSNNPERAWLGPALDLPISLTNAPILNKLYISNHLKPSYLRTQCDLHHCPLLESIYLDGSIDIINRDVSNPLPRLDYISWESFYIQKPFGYLGLFKLAANVREIAVTFGPLEETGETPHTGLDLPISPVVFARLQSLYVDMEFVDAMDLFRVVSFPSLTKLILASVPRFNETFVRLGATLKSIPLNHLALRSDVPEEAIEVASFLKFVKSVADLRYLEINDPLLDVLVSALQSHQISILPHLATLEIVLYMARDFEERHYRTLRVLKDVILACNRKYTRRFDIEIWFRYTTEDGTNDYAREYLRNDPNIMACTSEAFTLIVNGMRLESLAHANHISAQL